MEVDDGGKISIDDTQHHGGSRSVRVDGGGGYCDHVFLSNTSAFGKLTGQVWVRMFMRLGDVLLLPDHHVALYREQVDLDGASIGIRVTEAASRCGAVCDSVYEIDHFENYMLRLVKTKQ